MKEEHINRLEAGQDAMQSGGDKADVSADEQRPNASRLPDPALQDALYNFLKVLRKGTGREIGRNPNEVGHTLTYTEIKEKHKVSQHAQHVHVS